MERLQKTAVKVDFVKAFNSVGNAESARAIEPPCILWCIPGILQNRWNHAFKLLKKVS
jgi:8-hydroxy-5-deazaflavin:NADPH oxidoreductase